MCVVQLVVESTQALVGVCLERGTACSLMNEGSSPLHTLQFGGALEPVALGLANFLEQFPLSCPPSLCLCFVK